MPIVDLVFAVCLLEDPGNCHDEHLYFQSRGSLQHCMAEAIPTIAEWAGAHPGWRITGFRCEWANFDEERT
jgi:hypothetical protein